MHCNWNLDWCSNLIRVGNKYVFVFKYTNNPVFVFVFEVLKIYIFVFVFDHCIWLYLIKYRSVLKMFFFSDLKFDKGSWYLFCLNKIELDSNKTELKLQDSIYK